MSNHRVVKIDEHQLITCMKHNRWGSIRRVRSDDLWKPNDIIYFVVGDAIAAKAKVDDGNFFYEKSVWTLEKFKFQVNITFDNYIKKESRNSQSAKEILSINIAKEKQNSGYYYRGMIRLDINQIEKIENEFNNLSSLNERKQKKIVQDNFVDTFIDRLDIHITNLKKLSRVDYYDKKEVEIDFINTIWFIALVSTDKKYLRTDNFLEKQELINEINKFRSISKKSFKENDRELYIEQYKNKISQILVSIGEVYKVFGEYFYRLNHDYSKIIQTLSLIENIIEEFEFVHENNEDYNGISINWFFEYYLKSFTKKTNILSPQINMQIEQIMKLLIQSFGDESKINIIDPLVHEGKLISRVRNLDNFNKNYELYITDLYSDSIRLSIVRMLLNKIDVNQINLVEKKGNQKNKIKNNKSILIMNSLNHSKGIVEELLNRYIYLLNENDIVFTMFFSENADVLMEITKQEQISSIISQKTSSNIIIKLNFNSKINYSNNSTSIILMIGRKSDNDNFDSTIEYIDNYDELISMEKLNSIFVRKGYMKNNLNVEVILNKNSKEKAIIEMKNSKEKAIFLNFIKNTQKNTDTLKKNLSDVQNLLLEELNLVTKKGEYFSTTELLKKIEVLELNGKQISINEFQLEKTLEMFQALGILRRETVEIKDPKKKFYLSTLKKWTVN